MADRGTWKLVVGGATLATYTDVVTPRESDGMPIVQEDTLFGAVGIRNVQKGNFKLVWSFDILIEQTTNALATTFYLMAPQTWNGVKTVVLSHKDYAGTESNWQVVGAAVRVKPVDPIGGVTNRATVTITGGVIATYTPPA